jgi:uncharacterized protein involved in response to NO
MSDIFGLSAALWIAAFGSFVVRYALFLVWPESNEQHGALNQ